MDFGVLIAGALNNRVATLEKRADEDRTGGLQGDAIRNIVGNFYPRVRESTYTGEDTAFTTNKGAFDRSSEQFSRERANAVDNPTYRNSYGVSFDASRVVPTGSVNRPRNRLMRIYRRTA